MVTVVEFLQLAVKFLQPTFTALLKRLSLGQEGRVTPFLFLLSVELLPVSKVSKVSFIVGHEKGEELG